MGRWIRQSSSHLIPLRRMPSWWRKRPVRRIPLVVVVLSWTASPWLSPSIAISLHLLDSGDGRSVCFYCCDADSWPVVPKSSWSTTIQTHHDGNAVNAILVVSYHLVCGVRLAVYLNKGEAMRRTRTKKAMKKGRKADNQVEGSCLVETEDENNEKGC